MPLKKARKDSKKSFRKAVSANMHELVHNSNKKRGLKQIIAIAVTAAKGKKGKKK